MYQLKEVIMLLICPYCKKEVAVDLETMTNLPADNSQYCDCIYDAQFLVKDVFFKHKIIKRDI